MFQSLFEALLMLLVLTFNAVGLLLSWLPGILSRALWLAQMVLFISCDLYRRLLSWLRPTGLRAGVDLVANPWRMAACVLLSILVGLAVMALAGWDITLFGVGACAGHGLLVGAAWDQMGPPAGVRMGVH
jgi:hypothetical protein